MGKGRSDTSSEVRDFPRQELEHCKKVAANDKGTGGGLGGTALTDAIGIYESRRDGTNYLPRLQTEILIRELNKWASEAPSQPAGKLASIALKCISFTPVTQPPTFSFHLLPLVLPFPQPLWTCPLKAFLIVY